MTMSRREIGNLLMAGAIGSVGAPLGAAAAALPASATFVLVHGAWHGGWCWARVAQALRTEGHRVFAPSLSGLAERFNRFSADINLSTHVQDIVNLIRWEGLGDIILCGHSYGGMVITGVIAEIPDRIASVVYLDAFLPEKGQSLLDCSGGGGNDFLARVAQCDGVGVPPIPAGQFGVNAHDRAWVDRLCTKQPVGTFIEKSKAGGGLDRLKSRLFIAATGYGDGGLFRGLSAKLKGDPLWTVRQIASGHDVMIDAPDFVVEQLLGTAGAGKR